MATTQAGTTMIAPINEGGRKMENVTMSHCKVMWMPLIHEAEKAYEDGRTKAHAIFEHSEACVSDVVSNDAVSDDDIEGDTDDDVLDQDEDEKPPSLEESRIPLILRNLPSIDDYIEDSEREARENLFCDGIHSTLCPLRLRHPLRGRHYHQTHQEPHRHPVHRRRAVLNFPSFYFISSNNKSVFSSQKKKRKRFTESPKDGARPHEVCVDAGARARLHRHRDGQAAGNRARGPAHQGSSVAGPELQGVHPGPDLCGLQPARRNVQQGEARQRTRINHHLCKHKKLINLSLSLSLSLSHSKKWVMVSFFNQRASSTRG